MGFYYLAAYLASGALLALVVELIEMNRAKRTKREARFFSSKELAVFVVLWPVILPRGR